MQLINAAQRVGITYRQANYWAILGLIKTTMEDHHGEPADPTYAGTGYNRMISVEEMKVLRLMAHLVHGGVKPKAAVEYARKILAGKVVTIGPLRLVHREELKP